VIEYRLISEPPADLDVEAAFEWYENERQGLGLEFLDELREGYNRIVAGPLRRFPYAVYFATEGDIVVVVAVLHARRDPAEWQRPRG
jgi:hypothetical protein